MPRVDATCPFCGGEYALDTEFPLETSPGVIEPTAVALHSLPYCKEFLESGDALDFARQARRARQKASN